MSDSRPNVLHLIPHDVGQELGCYGRRPVPTPRLDALAAEGARFAGYVCASTPCSPSRGCIMTGQYAHRSGLIGLVNRGWELPRSVPTAVDRFAAAGYETVFAGLQHEHRSRSGLRYSRDLSLGADGAERTGDILIERGVARVIDYLRARRPGDPPFFLNLGSWEAHAPWSRPEYGPLRPRLEDVVVPPFLPDAPLVREQLAQFWAALAFLDEQVGRLLDALREVGLEDETLVSFTTDHGMAFPRAKGTLYEPGVQTALLMRWPGRIPAGRVVAERIPNVDLLPTYCEAAGLAAPAGIDGRSFWTAATGEGSYEARRDVFAERNFHDDFDPVRSVTRGRFKYVRYFAARRTRSHPGDMAWMREEPGLWRGLLDEDRPSEQLFDLVADPDERQSLAGVPEHAGRLSELREALQGWMDETGDPLRGARETVFWPGAEREAELDSPPGG